MLVKNMPLFDFEPPHYTNRVHPQADVSFYPPSLFSHALMYALSHCSGSLRAGLVVAPRLGTVVEYNIATLLKP